MQPSTIPPGLSRWSRRQLHVCLGLLLLALALGAALPSPTANAATTLPNFQVSAVFTGLKNPTDFQFAPDGRVFVAEKGGTIKVFDSLTDPTPTTFADLSSEVYKGPNDHGILGLALDPAFPIRPYVYVLYTYDAPIGGTAPRWNDVCPDPPGVNKNGCVVSGRLSRLRANGNLMTGSEQVLVEDWCQQFTSHSIGALGFGADGALYASAGEGANTSAGDYGQIGYSNLITYTQITPVNPCGDPPAGVGGIQTRPSAEGGALRAQDLCTPADPVGLSGTLIRVDPDTGAGLPDNPLAGSADQNARRIVAYGLRNPFRFTIRPGTSEAWIGDVGWGAWEEIDRVDAPTAGPVRNFGWPCYEGAGRQPVYDGFNLTLCEQLYSDPSVVTAPFYTYSHRESLQPGDACAPTTPCTSAITGLAFYSGGEYPAAYNGALFFADYGRHGIWTMFAGADGLPDPATRTPFIIGLDSPVSLRIGPNGDLFYADLTGTIYRVKYYAGNQPPIADAQATPLSGAPPLAVTFDGTGSSDADGDPISYAWDLDNDGQFDDSTAAGPNYTYTQAGNRIARLKVTDNKGAFGIATVTIAVGNTPPTAVIDTPAASATWKVGDLLTFTGHATDAQDGALPDTALAWTIVMHHCYSPTNCHEHLVQDYTGTSTGSFALPDHEDLPYIEIRLTATDSGGLSATTSVLLDPQTTTLSLRTNPSALQLVLDTGEVTTPLDKTVVAGSAHTLIAPPIQSHLSFESWADGSHQSIRAITIGATPATIQGNYVNRPPGATLSANPSSGHAPLDVAFGAEQAADPEGDTLEYQWQFGDGASATGALVTHRYDTPGSYQATLTVTDRLGGSSVYSVQIAVQSDTIGSGTHTIWLPLVMR